MRITYYPEQVRAVLENLGLDIASETNNNFVIYCPFHDNTNTPAFNVNKTNGLYICFNPTCRAHDGGNLPNLVARLEGKNEQYAKRLIDKRGSESIERRIPNTIERLTKDNKFPLYPQSKINYMKNRLWENEKALEYLRGPDRRLTDETIEKFEIGWMESLNMVVAPVHSHDGKPVGVNGRSIEGKDFWISPNTPRNKILVNLFRAKKKSSVVFCESQFDVMRIDQAGYNAVCPLGSSISPDQFNLIERHFDELTIMTDADKAGRQVGRNLCASLSIRIRWAVWDMGIVYPYGAKDVSDMTDDDDVAACIENAIPTYEYKRYDLLHNSS